MEEDEMNEASSTRVRKRTYKLHTHGMKGTNHCHDLGVEEKSKLGKQRRLEEGSCIIWIREAF
jgi:hypothetical protein